MKATGVDTPSRPEEPAWPPAGGEMAGRIRAHDWAATPLGPIEGWPRSLRTVVELMLAAEQPAYVAWGPGLISLHNDGYIPILGTKHPGALGKPYAELWAEIWDEYRPIAEATMAGEAQHFVDRPVAHAGRPGLPVGWFTFSWTPLRDETGAVAGFFCAATETTGKVRAEEALRESKEAALRESEARYRALFRAMDEGYLLADVLFDGQGRPVDIRYTEANPAAIRILGADPTGRRLSEIGPDHEPHWYEIWGRVARTGRGECLERYAASTGVWYDFYVFKPEGEDADSRRVAVVLKDVTDRKLAERTLRESEVRHAFLLKLSDALRSLADPAAMQEAASRILREHLNSDWACYCEFDEAAGIGTAAHGNSAEDVAGSAHGRALASCEAVLAIMRPGRTCVEGDVAASARLSAEARAATAALGMNAIVCAPIVKDGVLRAGVVAARRSPRAWTPAEVALVEDVADRTWAAVGRARSEAALRESEARFRMVAEAIEDVFYITDIDGGELLYLSPAYERVWGRPAAELRADLGAFIETLHPDDRPVFLAGKAAQERGEPVHTEYRVLRPDGSVRWIFDRSFPVPGAPGRCAAGVASDVTARKEAEASLREGEERFRVIVENARDYAIFTTDPQYRIADWLPGAAAVFGWSAEEVAGRPAALLFTPEDRARGEPEKEAETARTEGAAPDVRWHIRKDGSRVFIEGKVAALRDPDGRVRGFLKIGQDVTERRTAEDALRESERRFRALAEGIPQLVFRSRGSGERTWGSPQWIEYASMPEEESLGLGWLRAIHPEDRAATMAAWAEAEARGLFSIEHRVRRAADGAWRWFQSRAVPVPMRDGPDAEPPDGRAVEWLGTSTDIDDQVRAREVLARGREELEALVAARTAELMAAEETVRQSQKMEAVGQLTGGIAHDFNNMLQGVAGGLEMARRRVAEGRAGEAGRYLDAAREAVDRAAGLTRRLLAFARRQRLDPKPVDADGLVAGLADLVRRTTGPGIGVELNLRDGAGSVLCDPNELENALLNLCINARDAMPEGGRLLIGTEDVRLSAADVAGQEGAVPGDYVAISVSDTGTGMPPEVLERAVEPFFTTKPLGQGTGLGLSQVYGFARQSSGLVRLESTPGRGTTVRIFLPRHERAADEGRAAPAAPEREGAAGATVLLVDDEGAARGPAAERLRELGHRVLEAADGPAALRLLGDGARIDLLVTDVGLPSGMNGRQVAEAVRERWPGLPVLFITGYAGGPLPPGSEVIGKPFGLEALARRVKALLATAREGRAGAANPQAPVRPDGRSLHAPPGAPRA